MTHNAKAKVTREELLLRDYALTFPEATEDFPWGHRAMKVKKKAFVFMGTSEDGEWGMSVKLPETGGVALSLPFCRPAGYGLGKSGWVDVTMNGPKKVPRELVKQFIAESYRTVAPKTLVKKMDAAAKGLAPASKAAEKKRPANKRSSSR